MGKQYLDLSTLLLMQFGIFVNPVTLNIAVIALTYLKISK